jgi:hypothetical protein
LIVFGSFADLLSPISYPHGTTQPENISPMSTVEYSGVHQGREIIAIVALENGAFCTVFSENFHKI